MNKSLTELTDAGGCGCKIDLKTLKNIIPNQRFISKNLLVGNENNEDAAVYSLNNETGIVCTLDFFSPIVDDPFIFGQIAAANSLSDIYAMGGTPIVALSILGYPVDIIDIATVNQIIEGALNICDKAFVSLCGGHTINNPQPIYGLAVTGHIQLNKIKRNNNAKIGDLIYLTKPVGNGIISTAHKLRKVLTEDLNNSIHWMITLNSIGKLFGMLDYVNSLTDLTGFGFIGHLSEICNGSKVRAEIIFENINILDGVYKYIEKGIVTSGGKRNMENYKQLVNESNKYSDIILNDPQTNGGLLVTIDPNFKNQFEELLIKNNLIKFSNPIGTILARQAEKKLIEIIQ